VCSFQGKNCGGFGAFTNEQAANTEHPEEPEERSLGNAQNFSHTYCAFCRPWNCQDFARKVPKFTL